MNVSFDFGPSGFGPHGFSFEFALKGTTPTTEVQCDATPPGATKKVLNSGNCSEPNYRLVPVVENCDILNVALQELLFKSNFEVFHECDHFFQQMDIDQSKLLGVGRCAVCSRPASHPYPNNGQIIYLCEGADAWVQTRFKKLAS